MKKGALAFIRLVNLLRKRVRDEAKSTWETKKFMAK